MNNETMTAALINRHAANARDLPWHGEKDPYGSPKSCFSRRARKLKKYPKESRPK